MAAVLLGSSVLVFFQTAFRRQALAGNFAMRLRWDFHRRMLAQSCLLYTSDAADE